LAVTEKTKMNINLAYSYLDSKFGDMEAGVSSRYQLASLKHQVTNTIDIKYLNFSLLVATRFNQRIAGKSYWINDFRISQSIQKFTIYFDAQNILNTKYFEIGTIPLPSRWVSLGIKFVSF
jgi:outer membrane receptor protein involved in Fe transport